MERGGPLSGYVLCAVEGGDAGDTGGQAAKMGVVGSSGDDGRCRTQGVWKTGDEMVTEREVEQVRKIKRR